EPSVEKDSFQAVYVNLHWNRPKQELRTPLDVSNPCDETYGGTHAFSESETTAYHNYILGNKDRIKLYIATHSYGNELGAWHYTPQHLGARQQNISQLIVNNTPVHLEIGIRSEDRH
ncbi:unnamed protein product, partial [Timema podura]|nr:unnamed protein product [Timema podura]